MSDPAQLSLVEAAAAIRARNVSSLELVEACLARIERWQPKLNAFVAIEADEARAAARAADNAKPSGPLHGVPLAHKDMYYRAGKIATCGSKIRREWIAPTTSTALDRLASAGALQLGTLNMAEFAYGPTGHNAYLGHCRNPWHTDYITGGSSSGSGAAVAARLAFGSLGSDTGGSIRAPAGICGVTGIKPTWGRVSRAGAMPLSFTLDTVGPLARTAEDCALLLQIIAGPDERDPLAASEPVPDYVASLKQSPQGLRIGVSRRTLEAESHPEIVQAIVQACDALRAQGAEVIDVPGPPLDALSAHCLLVIQSEASSIHGKWMRERPNDYGEQVRARLEAGFAIPATAYLDALRMRGPALERFCATTLERADAYLCPTLAGLTPTITETDVGSSPQLAKFVGEFTRFMRWVNYLGLPSLNLACGFDSRGLPIGMQLVGRPFSESSLFRLGHAYQAATDWHLRLPGDAIAEQLQQWPVTLSALERDRRR